MNVFRSLAREVLQLTGLDVAKRSGDVSLRGALEKKVTPPVVKLDRWHDGFDRFPHGLDGAMHLLSGERPSPRSRWASLAMQAPMAPSFSSQTSAPRQVRPFTDGFDVARRAPVNLSGGVQRPVAAPEAVVSRASAFTASLDDLL
jgi:hypothetical protein